MPFARKHKVSLQANTVSRVSGVIGLSFPVFRSLQGRQLKSASSTTTEDGRRPSARLVVLTAAMSARRVTGAKFGCCSIVPIPAKESKIEGAQLNCASTSMVVTASCSICFQTAKGYRSPKSCCSDLILGTNRLRVNRDPLECFTAFGGFFLRYVCHFLIVSCLFDKG